MERQQDSEDEAEGASLCLGSSAWIAGASLGLAVFVLYLSTLAPAVLYYTAETKDAPVLPVAAYVLGIGHPAGYPTYTILTHLFTYLPVGDVAYRVNLASAVFGALAVTARSTPPRCAWVGASSRRSSGRWRSGRAPCSGARR